MNTPSPLIPQGATPPRAKSSIYFKILMVLSVHVVVIGGMLLQGCKDTTPAKDQAKQDSSALTPSDTASVTAPPPVNPTPAPSAMDTAPVANPSLNNTAVGSPVAAAPAPAPLAPPSGVGTLPPAKSTDLVPPTATGDAKEYVIAKGDTLGAIARRNGLSIKALMEANPGVNAKKLQIGQKVQIPAATAALATANAKDAAPGATADAAPADGSTYVVKSGDMLLKIAKAHGTTVKKIMAMNDLKSTSIRAGQKLKLPAGKTSSVEPAVAPAAASTAPMPVTTPMRVSAANSATGSPVAAN